MILSNRPLKSRPCLGLLYVLFRTEKVSRIQIFLNIFLFPFYWIISDSACVIRQSLAEGGGGESVGPGLATITRRRGKEAAPPRYSAQLGQQEQERQELLQCNIYDATPDHSILKHGLAKSLSNFHIGEFWCSDNLP